MAGDMWVVQKNSKATRWWCAKDNHPNSPDMYPPSIYALATEAEAQLWCDIFNSDPDRAAKEIATWGKSCGS
jgi:hypothetical protein